MNTLKLKSLSVALAFLSLTAMSTLATTINFDDLDGTGGGTLIPNGYYGLNWDNFYAYAGKTEFPLSGFTPGTISDPNIADNGFGTPATISSNTPFNLISGYFTAAWNDELQLQVIGSLNGTTVYDVTFTLSATEPLLLNFNLLGIDSVQFNSFGGTDHPGYTGSGTHFAVDNLVIETSATLQLAAAVSRKTHGTSGNFDLPLALSPAGSGTVEPRANGPTAIVFAFSDNIAAADGTISANEFTVTNATFSSASILGSTLTLNLTGVVDQSVVSITLNGINDTGGNPLAGDNDVEIRALAGDANQDRIVDRSDLQGVKDHVGQALEQMSGNYLFDLDLDGVIARGDGRVVRMNKLHTVP